jgi:hypothetical protein
VGRRRQAGQRPRLSREPQQPRHRPLPRASSAAVHSARFWPMPARRRPQARQHLLSSCGAGPVRRLQGLQGPPVRLVLGRALLLAPPTNLRTPPWHKVEMVVGEVDEMQVAQSARAARSGRTRMRAICWGAFSPLLRRAICLGRVYPPRLEVLLPHAQGRAPCPRPCTTLRPRVTRGARKGPRLRSRRSSALFRLLLHSL